MEIKWRQQGDRTVSWNISPRRNLTRYTRFDSSFLVVEGSKGLFSSVVIIERECKIHQVPPSHSAELNKAFGCQRVTWSKGPLYNDQKTNCTLSCSWFKICRAYDHLRHSANAYRSWSCVYHFFISTAVAIFLQMQSCSYTCVLHVTPYLFTHSNKKF